jgi:cytochrome c biogenesis protein CcmG/thiol:disulfide interchange protein DsbE
MKAIRHAATGLLMLLATSIWAQEPDFRLRDLDNQWKEYSDLKGEELTIIDFWATWCQPCVRSIPLLSEIAKEFEAQGVNFIGVSIDGPRNQSKIKPFMQSMGVNYPVIRDIDTELMSDLGVTAVPTLLIYDSNGDLVFFHEGFRPGDEDVVRTHIKEHLEN